MSEEYSIAESKQTDFGFRVDAQTEDPSRPDALPIRPLRMTLSWVGSLVLAPSIDQVFDFSESNKLIATHCCNVKRQYSFT